MSIVKHTKEHDKLGVYGYGPNVIPVGSAGRFKTLHAALLYIQTLKGEGIAYDSINGTLVLLGSGITSWAGSTKASETIATTAGSSILTGSAATAFEDCRPGDVVVYTNTTYGTREFHFITEVYDSGLRVNTTQGALTTEAAEQFIVVRPINYTLLLTDAEYANDVTVATVDVVLPHYLSLTITGIGQHPNIRNDLPGNASGTAQYLQYQRNNVLRLQDLHFINAAEFIFPSTQDTDTVKSACLYVVDCSGEDYQGRSVLDLFGSRVWVQNFNGINTWFRGFKGDDIILDGVNIRLTKAVASTSAAIDFGINGAGQTAYPAILKNSYIVAEVASYDNPIISFDSGNIGGKTSYVTDTTIKNTYSTLGREAVQVAGNGTIYMRNCFVDGKMDLNAKTVTLRMSNVRRTTDMAQLTVASGDILDAASATITVLPAA